MLLIGTMLLPRTAEAGIYSDDLAKCLVARTSDDEKMSLAKWIFSVISAHPGVASIATVDDASREAASRDTAAIFEKLLTESCKEQTTLAMKYEGTAALKASFKVLGEIAMTSLLTEPKVAAESQGFVKFMDEAKLKTVFGEAQAGD
ncbi:hypothetical protein [Luteimonas aquatica]|uniref:hypothetical protein n=1 Tax=Luteimonas aquatica TaxID=450364 RepID=UPI001F589F61|nr:hypothetical protein [Luteimonas aquatica]